MQTKKKTQILLMLTILTLCFASRAFAEVQNVNHAATVSVPSIMSIAADTGSFTLTMPGFASGSESDTKTIVYTVQSNDIQQGDDATVIDAAIDFAYDRIDLKAQVGSYTKTAGNTELQAASAGYVTIGAGSNTVLAKKANTTADSDGRVLQGTFPVTYKAVATADLSAGDQTHILYVNMTSR